MLLFKSRVKMPENKMLEAALLLAEAGFYVFPCAAGTKRPACKNGVHDATRDMDQIRQWWAEDPRFNIAVSPSRSGCFVLDVDPPLGAETLFALELEQGLLPRTLTIQTPRGGLHKWFKGECKSTVGTLGPNLDTRGGIDGESVGYVLMPPSIINGKEYTYEDATIGISVAPGWIAEQCGRTRHEPAQAASSVELDTAGNVERARNLLQRYRAEGHVAIEGAGGDDLTYRVCAEILNLGLTAEKTWHTLLEEWNPACIPPWSEDELEQKVRNAAEYAQNDQGAWAVPSGQELFGAFALSEACIQTSDKKISRFYPLALDDVDAFAEPAWLIPGLIPKGGTVQITGPQKSFKTFLALEMALGVASGSETFGHRPLIAPVVYVAGENAAAIALKHVPAWRLAHAHEGPLPFFIVPNMPRAAETAEIEELIREIKAREIAPAVVVIDTATRALRGLDENSAKDMGIFSAACEHIQRELDCTVIVIRHTGKDAARGGRGSNVIEGDFDTVLAVERHEKSMFVALTVKEQRNAAEREEPFAFEGQVVGPSLAFKEIAVEAYRRATRPEDVYSPSKIGAALRGMGAIGVGRAVTTSVLATHLVPLLQDESPEDRATGLSRAGRALKALSRGQFLAGYTFGDGAGLRWCLPDAPGE